MNAPPGSASAPPDPLTLLAALPGVAEAVASARAAVDRARQHRVVRRGARGASFQGKVAAEAALRAARASAALSGADWSLEEVRRRSDFGGEGGPRLVGAALRLTAEAGRSRGVWRSSPLGVLARLHLVAAGGPGEAALDAAAIGRPRQPGEDVATRNGDGGSADSEDSEDSEENALGARLGPAPGAREVAARLDALARLVSAGSAAPALVTSAVVHGELATLRPFRSHNGLVARAAERVALVGGGLDPAAMAPAEVGHAEQGRDGYLTALAGYASGTPEGVSGWIVWCGRAVELGARETLAVCEAFLRGG